MMLLVLRGSPPRMRGKAISNGRLKDPDGITPAYAGKSLTGLGIIDDVGDHPRVCGEKYPVMDDAFIDMGSPPRVRGKAHSLPCIAPLAGITPACAGKRHCPRSRPGRIRDSPRACGEKGCCRFSSLNHSGSPPRMRGKVKRFLALLLPSGITPAYAGKRVLAFLLAF